MAQPPLASLLAELVRDVGILLRQELRLAQVETAKQLEQARNGIYAILSGLLTAFCALLILLQAVVAVLASVMPAWLAALIVALSLAAVAFLLIRHGNNSLVLGNFVPRRTLRTLHGSATGPGRSDSEEPQRRTPNDQE